MAETHETIADIIAEKRRRADEIERDCAEKMKRGEMVSDCYARELVADIRREADRLEAACAKMEADALAVGGIVEAERKRERGNSAKLREALKATNKFLESAIINGKVTAQDITALRNIVSAALSAPPRNCDRPECATTKSAQEVWRREDGGKTAYYEWLLATATEKKGESNVI